MSTLSIDCPECAWTMEIDKTDLGATIKCPKCKESFIAEEPGLYDFVETPKPKAESWSPPPAPSSPSSSSKKTKSSRPTPVETASKDEDDSMSDEQLSDLMSNMEKWAEE